MIIALATHHFAADIAAFFLENIDSSATFVMAEPGKKYDLIVFSGGADIDPAIYGEENISSFVDSQRDKIEKNIWVNKHPLQKFFGICRGHQLLNALTGGKLCQHVVPPHPAGHMLTNGMQVNSLHHQAVILVGDGVTPVANAFIGGKITPEIEITVSRRFFSVQFHPEFILPSPSEEFIAMVKEFLYEGNS